MRTYAPIIVAALLAMLSVYTGISAGASSTHAWQLAARYSARTAFIFFLIVYSVGPMARLWPKGVATELARNRRYWGLGFAAAHGVHLGALVMFQLVSKGPFPIVSVVIGGPAYMMVLLLTATSNSWAKRRLGKHWKTLHRTGMHIIWFVFAASYFKRIFNPDQVAQGLFLFPLALGALGLRFAAYVNERNRSGQRTSLQAPR